MVTVERKPETTAEKGGNVPARRSRESATLKRFVSPTQRIPHLHAVVGNHGLGRMLQAKLAINQPGDAYEQEADRVAAQVTSESHALPRRPVIATRASAAPLQRKCSCGGTCSSCQEEEEKLQRKATHSAVPPAAVAEAPAVVHDVLRSSGHQLDAATRAYFEPRFGYDFSSVRIHNDSRAAESARSVNALAYTVGQNIVFDRSQYSPGTSGGRRLLAHELTHTVQQSGGSGEGGLVQRKEWPVCKGVQVPVGREASVLCFSGLSGDVVVETKRLLNLYHQNDTHWKLLDVKDEKKKGDYDEDTRRAVAAFQRQLGPKQVDRQDGALTRKTLSALEQATAVATTPQAAPPEATPKPTATPVSHELTEQDAASCSPLYLQKLCVYITGGFNGDRSGVETPEEMSGYNQTCRAESGYGGPDVELSTEERASLRSPRCARGDPESARRRARAKRIADALDRSTKYMPGAIGEQLVNIVNDPVFLGSLALAIGVYLALWLAPEPVFTKIAAAATTIAILSTGVFSISTLISLAEAWMDLDAEAGDAKSDEEIERAAEHFGKRMGAVEANLLVFLASLLVGGKLPGPKGLPAAGEAIAGAERSLAATTPGDVVVEGPWGSARRVGGPSAGTSAPSAKAPAAFEGNAALKIELAPRPEQSAEVIPFPKPKAAPGTAAGQVPTPKIFTPVVPGLGPNPQPERDREEQDKCRKLAPQAIPIRWPSPLWHFTKGIGDPGSKSIAFDFPDEQVLVKRGSTLYNKDRPEIGRYETRIQGPPFNLKIPTGWPIHHKWPLYLGGPGDKEQAEGEYDAEGRIVHPPNLVALPPDVHSAWHRFLSSQPTGPRPGQGPSERTPDGTTFCVLNRS